jgi:hypothetical protein
MKTNKDALTLKLARLRQLIQAEIDYSFQVENEYRFAYETRQSNDRAWKEFASLFAPGEEEEEDVQSEALDD